MKWHSLFELLLFPIGVIMAAVVMIGVGNLITNPVFSLFYSIQSDFVIVTAEAVSKVGTFLLVNFPLLILLRIVTKKSGSATTIISAFAGYITYAVFTMYFSANDLTSNAYSSILGLSVSSSSTTILNSGTKYPLQTGIIATLIVALITLSSYNASRRRSDYSFFAFVSKDTGCVIRTIVFCAIAGVLVAYGWPYVLDGLNKVITFIASDTTNPVNLMIYGSLERILMVFNLGSIIRSPFWYGTSGGSWMSMAGTSVAGDVNIWTAQLSANSIASMTGRFITPYYVLNIFAVPAMILAIFSVHTDKLERTRLVVFYLFAIVVSMFCGTLLPLELILFTLCPLLFFMHIGCTGLLYGIFQALHVALGFNYTGTATVAVNPGTLLEFLSYASNSSLHDAVIKVVIVGLITAVVYFFMTKFYFNHLALDLFRTGEKDRIIKETIESVGGIENIKLVHSSINRLVISLYDPSKLDVNRLKQLGSVRIYETKAGYAICFGSSSTMIRRGISKEMRSFIRES